MGRSTMLALPLLAVLGAGGWWVFARDSRPKALDPLRVDALVAAAKPAHVEHRVEIVKRGARTPTT